ncbi:MAG: ABC transporter ATP-binding protein [Acidobacteria bacterium]|nr:ABC transporter ATP-binding protein [Acidobacteriota bacterium]MCI0622005.1 ABC transporter ATP-binding protein [Acidobacteriota bacterium]
MPPVLEFQAISKSFGQQPILRDISLSVDPAEFLTLLGPSGSGKTTLLRLAAGFERPDAGKVLLRGDEISHLPPYRRRVNTVFQNYALFPHLNVADNVAFGLRNLNLAKPEILARARAALEMVQLGGLAARFPHQLSGGQQQRVALARALVMQPDVLLLDEPFGALDQRLRHQMQQELKTLQRRLELAFVFVTHDQEEALSLSDRIALLHEGRLEQIGVPDQIFNRPATRFAAEFMGIPNIFPLSATTPDAEGIRCRLDNGEWFLVKASPASGSQARFLAIRPAHISIARTASGNCNVLHGRVRQARYLGTSVLWSVEAGSRTWAVSQPLNGGDGPASVSLEDEVFLWWEPGCGVLVG